MSDDFELNRFVVQQEHCYATVVKELKQGHKVTHWMWFVFPQIAGLGHSAMAREYAINSREEGLAYLAHPLLGKRLRECAQLVLAIKGRTVDEIFAYPDDRKLCSSMTLFANLDNSAEIFQQVLDRYYDGQPDHLTLDILNRS